MHTNPTKGDHNFFGAILYRIAFISGAKMGYVCEGRKKARLNEIKKIKIGDTLYLEVKWTKIMF